MQKQWFVAVLLVFLCGCFKVKDELTIQPDGSGTVRIETRLSLPNEMEAGLGMSAAMEGMGGGLVYPPATEAEAHKFFPGQNFTVTVKQERADDGSTVTIVDAAFKDINSLLASPYGHAHALTLKLENGSLVLKAITGLEAAARFAEMKPEGEMAFMAFAGLGDAQKKKQEMRAELRFTLPNTITAANGPREAKTASWVMERAQAKDPEEFAQKLGSVLEARCAADGLKFSPATPLRLALTPFTSLSTDGVTEKVAARDTNQIAAAAKFVPYSLRVTRHLDLTGEGGGQQNSAQLIGAVELPEEFTPQKWGEVKLKEALDAKGNSLKPETAEESMRAGGFSSVYSMGQEDEEEGKATASNARHMIMLNFKPPDWKTKEIARVSGSLSLHYFGGAQLVKLTNAIPAKWIAEGEKALQGFDAGGKSLNDPKLRELGLSFTLQMGMAQSGMTVLSFQVGGKQAALSDAQVFDSSAKPWPTFLQQQNIGEQGSCQIMVAGKPQPPLSLALLVSGGGAAVEVPILVEHVPLTPAKR